MKENILDILSVFLGLFFLGLLGCAFIFIASHIVILFAYILDSEILKNLTHFLTGNLM